MSDQPNDPFEETLRMIRRVANGELGLEKAVAQERALHQERIEAIARLASTFDDLNRRADKLIEDYDRRAKERAV